jgi:hypothetical protein
MKRARVLRLLPLAGVTLAACGPSRAPTFAPQSGSGGTSTGGSLIAIPAKNEWPDRFLKAAPDVQEAYRFALANKDTLQYMPCYCGCVNDGHTSNYDCYVKEARPDGSFLLEPMSFG